MPTKPILRYSEKEIWATFDINVVGVLWTIQAFLPAMIANNKGQLVVMSSMAGLMGNRNLVPYCGSKFAVKCIMEALAIELHEDKTKDTSGIKFTTIYPTMVNTGLCKNPKFRFSLFTMVETEFAAGLIVDAIRREHREISIPTDLYYSNRFLMRLLPEKAGWALTDFVGTAQDPEDEIGETRS